MQPVNPASHPGIAVALNRPFAAGAGGSASPDASTATPFETVLDNVLSTARAADSVAASAFAPGDGTAGAGTTDTANTPIAAPDSNLLALLALTAAQEPANTAPPGAVVSETAHGVLTRTHDCGTQDFAQAQTISLMQRSPGSTPAVGISQGAPTADPFRTSRLSGYSATSYVARDSALAANDALASANTALPETAMTDLQEQSSRLAVAAPPQDIPSASREAGTTTDGAAARRSAPGEPDTRATAQRERAAARIDALPTGEPEAKSRGRFPTAPSSPFEAGLPDRQTDSAQTPPMYSSAAAAIANAAASTNAMPGENTTPLTNDLRALPPATNNEHALAAMQAHAPAETSPERVMALFSHPASTTWRGEFVESVRVLTSEKVQVAELQLHPADMGPVSIRISLADQQASITFAAGHEETRRAIEQALPQLRDMLNESGIRLDSASVGNQSPRNPQDPRPAQQADSRPEPVLPRPPRPARPGLHLVDTYA